MATDQDFSTSLAFVLDAETGGDPTGALHTDNNGALVKWGINAAANPGVDVRTLTQDEAAQIYRSDYWIPSLASVQPMPLAQVVFDTAVNMGVSRAKALLTQSQGDVATYLALRAQAYQTIAARNPANAPYLAGWLQRLQNLADAISPAAIAGGTAVVVLLGIAIGILAVYKRQHETP